MTYAGDVTPEETFRALGVDEDAVLVDVRTVPELQFVGLPDLSGIGKRVATVAWQTFPHGTVNGAFVEDLRKMGITEDQPVYFICRSGARSRAAAMTATAAGFVRAYNVAGGFEGVLDADGHRGRTDGWKACGLPWRQG